VVPAARATTIALNSIGFGIGRSGGALLATLIYPRLGFLPVTVLAVVFNGLALLGLAEMQQRVHILGRVLAWIGRPRKSG
jgi:hypothetical protein